MRKIIFIISMIISLITFPAMSQASISEILSTNEENNVEDTAINDNVHSEREDITVGKDEVRAWTFKKGMNAKKCAGIIHTDFEKGFIKAEVMSYDDLIKYGSEQKVKEAGRARLEGKDYIMQDGDICYFRFNV